MHGMASIFGFALGFGYGFFPSYKGEKEKKQAFGFGSFGKGVWNGVVCVSVDCLYISSIASLYISS
jgi:hypothetical protein